MSRVAQYEDEGVQKQLFQSQDLIITSFEDHPSISLSRAPSMTAPSTYPSPARSMGDMGSHSSAQAQMAQPSAMGSSQSASRREIPARQISTPT